MPDGRRSERQPQDAFAMMLDRKAAALRAMAVERHADSGFSMLEIALVAATIGIMAVLATPMFLRYHQSAQLSTAARQVAATLNNGRQLAISRNDAVCVHNTTTSVHYHLST